jgi:integrase
MRRVPGDPWYEGRGMYYGMGFGDRRVFSLASGDARTRVGTKLALVFPGERGTPFSGWSKAKAAFDTASGVSGWWLHDLRRTLATGLQRLGVRLEVTEAVLNHLSGSRAGVVGIYQRHDWAEEKRPALDACGVGFRQLRTCRRTRPG